MSGSVEGVADDRWTLWSRGGSVLVGDPMAPVVGRERELRVLGDAVAAAAAGTTQLVLISGPAGVGKSRLAGEVARTARASGMLVSWGRCLDRHDRAYSSLRQELLPFLAGEFADEEQYRSEVEELGLIGDGAGRAEGGGGVVAVLDRSQQARVRQLLALSTLTADAAQDAALAIVVDDVDEADQATLDFLEELLAQAGSVHRRPLKLLVVATHRLTKAGRNGDLLARLRSWPGVRGLALGGLSHPESCELVRGLGVDPDGVGGQALVRRAQGNPLFLETLARKLRRSGPSDGARSDPDPEPSSVGEAVADGLAAQPDEMTALLLVLSVLGDGVSAGQLAEVAQMDVSAAGSLLGDAVGAGIVQVDDDAVAFTHQLFADQLRAVASAGEWEALHLRAADLTADDAIGLVRHLISAGSLAVPNRLFEAAYDAAAEAASLGSWAEAARYWEAAGEAHERIEKPNRHAIAGCYEDAALMSILSSDLVHASALAARAEEMHEQVGDVNGVARARLIDYRCTIYQGEFGVAVDAEPLLEMAADDRLDPTIRTEALISASELAWMTGDSGTALALAASARHTATAADLDAMRSASLVSTGTAQWLRHDLIGALDSADEAMNVCRSSGIAEHGVVPAGRRAFTLWLLGRSADAAQGARDALALADEAALPLERSVPLAVQIHQAVAAHDLDAAEGLADEAMALQRSSLDRWAAPLFLPSLTVGHIAAGRYDLACAHLDDLEGDHPSGHTGRAARLFGLWARAMVGEATEADRATMKGYADPGLAEVLPAVAVGVTGVCAALVDVCDALDLPASAVVPGRRLVEAREGGQVMTATLQALVPRACGTALRLTGDHDAALGHLGDALNCCAEMGLVIELARTHIEMARTLSARDNRGDRDRARHHVEAFRVLCDKNRLPGLVPLARTMADL